MYEIDVEGNYDDGEKGTLFVQLRGVGLYASTVLTEEFEWMNVEDCEESIEDEAIAREEESLAVGGSPEQFGVSPVDGSIEMLSEVHPGMLIKSPSFSAVYYVTEDLTRRSFPSAQIFFTHYDSFDDIIEVTDATLPSLTLDQMMTPKAGTVLIKTVFNSATYEIDEENRLRKISDEAEAQERYGENWSDYVMDVHEYVFSALKKNGEPLSANGSLHEEMMSREEIDVRVASIN